MPRVLWVTDEVPDRTLGGGNIRQAHLLSALGDTAHVTLLVVGRMGDDPCRAAVGDLVEVHDPGAELRTGPLSRRLHLLWLALGARGGSEVALGRRRRRAVRGELARLAPDHDVVLLHHPGLADLVPARGPVGRGVRPQWAIHLFHLTSAKARQHEAIVPGARRRWLHRREAVKSARLEAEAARRADLIVLCSAADERDLRAMVPDRHLPIVIAPNGVDLDEYAPGPLPSEPALLLPASLNYGPNVDGAVWFADHVFPIVRDAVPGARLVLVGRAPEPEVRALDARPGIEVHADVPAMRPWFDGARAVVVPLRIGTGTRLKALEAMASGRPVVGTSTGLEGIGVRHGAEALVADDPADLAAHVVAVLTDDDLARRLAEAGRRHVEAGYGWAAIGRAFAAELSAAVDGAGQPAP